MFCFQTRALAVNKEVMTEGSALKARASDIQHKLASGIEVMLDCRPAYAKNLAQVWA